MTANPTTTTVAEATAMSRARELALKGPITGPNPQVGCVLLDASGTVIAEGWHDGSGTPHAEVVALSEAKASGVDTSGLTAVVTLEPCSHTGKTGPCAQALIDAGIARVVYSVSDPGGESGGGAAVLQDAGIDVVSGLDEEAGLALIERWHHSVTLGRPWVTIKWAMSWDGRAAAADGTSQWITGPATREKVHLERSRHDAIVVGTTTALVDDPSLTARTPSGELYQDQPRALVVGNRGIPESAQVRSHPGGFHHHRDHDLDALMSKLFSEGARSLYVEGGPTLASAFIAAGLVDEIHITVGPLLLGGPLTAIGNIAVSTMSDALALHITELARVGDDVVVTARVTRKAE
jgi:diaminohydroxyphosphoribosylaminopyrimidine deaminase / 5-amino-6-(5-phosphoribosylamino)uracil reductase